MTVITAQIFAVCPDSPGPGGFAALIQNAATEIAVTGGHPCTTRVRILLTATVETLKFLDLHAPAQGGQPAAQINTCDLLLEPPVPHPKLHAPPTPNQDLWDELRRLTEHRNVSWKADPRDPRLQRCSQTAAKQVQSAAVYGIPWSTASMPLFADDGAPERLAPEPPQAALDRTAQLQQEVLGLRRLLRHVFSIAGQSQSFNDYRNRLADYLLRHTDLFER